MKLIFHSSKLVAFQNRNLLKKLKYRTKRKRKKKLRIVFKPKDKKFETPQQKLKREIYGKRRKWTNERVKYSHEFYKPRTYDGLSKDISIVGEIGLETNLANFLGYAENLIDCDSKKITIDISQCGRVWPSAVTLFCSLQQWRNITTLPGKSTGLSSTNSNFNEVNAYLAHCGFYDYVSRSKSDVPEYHHYSDERIVKIKKEITTRSRFVRQDEILDLLHKYSDLNDEEIEYFGDMILTEIITNMIEHGISMEDGPWYALSQYHEKTGIISICIADNGIGIKNTLITGPQKDQIAKELKLDEINDGRFILKAKETNVSGASLASTKKGFILKTLERGARRGNGLKRITDYSKKLGIKLNILSQRGCVSFHENGEIDEITKKSRVFAGTLYHLVVPAKKGDKSNDKQNGYC